jgi:predicted molibdopterin-dependent oxidoreductase YjgC
LANFADVYVQQRLGSDVALLNGMMHVIYKNGWHNQEFIDERCEGFEDFIKVIENFSVEQAAEITGVAADDIVKMAEIYAKSEKSSLVYCMGITQHITGVDNVKSLANLAMLCGQIGRESTGVNPLRGQNNVQGACDMGGLPNVYPGYQVVTSEDVRNKFENAWGVSLSPNLGLTITNAMNLVDEGKIKAIVILGENPLVSDPDVNHARHVMEHLDFLMCIDIFPHETSELAHVVLPASCYAEKDGTFTNSERRVQMVRKAVDAPGESRVDWEIIQEIAKRLGYDMNYQSAEEIFNELASLTPQYGGMSYDRLQGEGLCWPCPTPDHPGTPFLHKGRFSRGQGLFHAVEYKDPAEMPDDEFPFWFTTGREYMHYHTGTMTRVSPHLHHEMPEPVMEINAEDAERLGVEEGQRVKVASRRGEIVSQVRVTDRIGKGVVFMPFHFAESCANKLTNSALDPIAKIPELKVCAVKVEKAA